MWHKIHVRTESAATAGGFHPVCRNIFPIGRIFYICRLSGLNPDLMLVSLLRRLYIRP